MQKKVKVGVLVSGTGSNFQALVDACKDKNYPAEIVCVGSNKLYADGISKALDEGLASFIAPFHNRKTLEKFINERFMANGVELICLAGYMEILSVDFIKHWERRILNIHPSLLPSFKGRHAQRQALEHGVKFSGCTVHYVVSEVDAGPILGQRCCPVLEDDTEETLSNRILVEEHQLYPEVLNSIAIEILERAND